MWSFVSIVVRVQSNIPSITKGAEDYKFLFTAVALCNVTSFVSCEQLCEIDLTLFVVNCIKRTCNNMVSEPDPCGLVEFRLFHQENDIYF